MMDLDPTPFVAVVDPVVVVALFVVRAAVRASCVPWTIR
jgi:hypothetical protein